MLVRLLAAAIAVIAVAGFATAKPNHGHGKKGKDPSLLVAGQSVGQFPPSLMQPPGITCSGGTNTGGGPNGPGCQTGPYETTIRGNLNIGGNLAAPTYGSGGGGSASFGAYDINSRFRVTTSGAPSTSVVVNFNGTYNGWQAAPACFVNGEQNTTIGAYAVATTAHVTINWIGSVASAVFDVVCIGTQAPTNG
ncbi:MAG TPA: hypothetical protein VGR84_18835 [Candidatus Acidoferrales bacterium]|nr:hypothetical protein [Candidatus Acidoferrales bacterium]